MILLQDEIKTLKDKEYIIKSEERFKKINLAIDEEMKIQLKNKSQEIEKLIKENSNLKEKLRKIEMENKQNSFQISKSNEELLILIENKSQIILHQNKEIIDLKNQISRITNDESSKSISSDKAQLEIQLKSYQSQFELLKENYENKIHSLENKMISITDQKDNEINILNQNIETLHNNYQNRKRGITNISSELNVIDIISTKIYPKSKAINTDNIEIFTTISKTDDLISNIKNEKETIVKASERIYENPMPKFFATLPSKKSMNPFEGFIGKKN